MLLLNSLAPVGLALVIWGMLVLASWYWNASQTRQALFAIMANQGRDIFRIIEATRLWNAQHGGVYGLRSEATPSNPYLNVAGKDIDAPGGKPLTLLNPAYMTRQLSSVILDRTGVRIHITSLKPINPDNQAQPWEAVALGQFEQGRAEYFDVEIGQGQATARFMRPLITKPPCLACHGHQGYGAGDIRGGISVAFDASPFLAQIEARNLQLAWVHGVVWLLLSGLTLVAIRIIGRQFGDLREAKAAQDQLVALRTHELHTEMRERKEAESFLRMLVDSSGEAMFGVDKEGHCNFINPAALRLLGYHDPQQVAGLSLLALVQTRETVPDQDSYIACRSLKHGEYVHAPEAWFVRADGKEFPVEYRSHPIFAEGRIAGAVITFSDISDRKARQDAVWFQANHDALTGLPNRGLFEDRLDNALSAARRQLVQGAVLFVDLDRFKAANDRHGHAVGDALLREAAQRMRACVRESDTVARLGGDEFVILLAPPIQRGDAEQTAARLGQRLAEPYSLAGLSIDVSASIGIALFPEAGDRPDWVLRHADAAMYAAKAAGRDTWRVYGEAGGSPG